MTPRRVLITGGAGFVGVAFAEAFRRDDVSVEVVAFDNLRRRGSELNLPRLQALGCDFVHGDIRSPGDLAAIRGDFDVMVEASAEPSVLAGLDGANDYVIQTNLVGTLNALEFARHRVGATVFLSTSRVYSIAPLRSLPLVEDSTRLVLRAGAAGPGWSEDGITEDFATTTARSLYGATKLASELFVQEYVDSYGLRAVVNRCGVIAGPGQFGKVDQGVFTLWVAHHHFGLPLRYIGFGGTGKQVRDLLHPQDLYVLTRRQLDEIEAIRGEVFNVGGGREGAVSLQELTALCQEATGGRVAIGNVPDSTGVDVPWFVTDATRAQQRFGWAPKRGPRQIVEEIAGWIAENETSLRPLFVAR